MRKIFTLSALVLSAGLILPSCGTHLNISKRQHSRGYYVDISSDKKSQQKNVETNETELSVVTPEIKKSDKIKATHVLKTAENTEIVAVTSENQTKAAEETVISATKVAPKITKNKANFPGLKSLVTPNKSLATNSSSNNTSIKQLAKNQQIQKMESQRNGDGLSLFWIVILILLILYALGLIGGLGWFIHIALVVALILLILWLLGIV